MTDVYALYGRQSRDKKDSISIDSQFEFCMKEVPEGAQVKKYKDKGYSGKNIERPDFQKLLKDIENGIISKVVVYRLDRMSRSTLDFADLMNKFKNYNVDFISATEKFDTSTPIGQAMLSIIMVFAELERKTIQQRITDNYYERGKKGMFLGGNLPFGFELQSTRIDGYKTNMLLTTTQIEYVKVMFDEYANTNSSLGKIAKKFNELGIKTLKNGSWSSAGISRTLKNPAYVKADADIYDYFKSKGCIMQNEIDEYIGFYGIYSFGKGNKLRDLENFNIVLAPHEGIIDSSIWLKCQYKLMQNEQIKNAGKSKHSWLSGLIKCAKCKHAMSVNRSELSPTRKTFASYFRCSGRTIKKICDAPSIRVEDAEDNVRIQMIDYVKNIDSIMKINKSNATFKVNELKISIANKENEIENLIDSLAGAKGASMKYINKRLDKLDEEMNILRDELKKESQSDSLDSEKIIRIKELLDVWDNISLEEKKEVANSLIEKVYVEDGIIDIVWKI